MIRYTFHLSKGPPIVFEVDERVDSSVENPQDPVPDWLALEFHQCSCCSLPPGSRRTCPAALSIRPAVEVFSPFLSHRTAQVTAELGSATLQAGIPLQQAVRSVAGLLLALSSCPVLGKLRPMAQFHVPFSTAEHTSFRFVASHLVGQYLRQNEGLTPDWALDGLRALFGDIHEVNTHLARRLGAASQRDTVVNSVILLDSVAGVASYGTESQLKRLKPLFASYLADPADGAGDGASRGADEP